jgi:hypothetical protein
MASLIVPYSCRFSRMCSAYADCGLFFLYNVCARGTLLQDHHFFVLYMLFGMSCKLVSLEVNLHPILSDSFQSFYF